jgi:hypothetical protein
MNEAITGELEIDLSLLPEPDIKVLEPKDPLSSADRPRVQYEWVKQVVPQINAMLPADRAYDVDKLLKGEVMSMILSDDSNCFPLAKGSHKRTFEKDVQDGILTAERLTIYQRKLLHRLNWEVGVTELDERIRTKIKAILLFLSAQGPWQKWEDIQTARRKWEQVRHLAENIRNDEPSLREACNDYNKHLSSSKGLSSLFYEFLTKAEKASKTSNPESPPQKPT